MNKNKRKKKYVKHNKIKKCKLINQIYLLLSMRVCHLAKNKTQLYFNMIIKIYKMIMSKRFKINLLLLIKM